MPEISVIVPVYKVEPYLSRCVESILAQTYIDFELILVDDGSPDNCGKLCDEFAQKDKRIHVIHQKNGGLSAARNSGIDWACANSDSKWISFIDSDDWVHEGYLDALLKAAKQSECAVSLCGYQKTDGKDLDAPSAEFMIQVWNTETFYVQKNVNATIACGKLYYKTCFEQIRYPVGKIHEDEYVTYKILFQFESVAVVENALYYYFVNPKGIMQSQWSTGRLAVLEANKEQILFFKNNGYKSAYRWAIQSYVWNISKSYNWASQLNCGAKYKQKLKHALRKEIRQALHKYYHEADVRIGDCFGVYEVAYPRFAQIYRYGSLIKRQLLKLIHNVSY